MIIAITGPTGAGKTTVAEGLVKLHTNRVNIDVDHIKHMNPNAFKRKVDEDGDEDFPYSGWKLLGENVGLLTSNFNARGYDVIINGYLEVAAWVEIEKVVKIDYKLLLLPDLEKNKKRDASRTSEIKMGEKAVKRGRDYFKKTDYYESFIKVDTTHESIQETVQSIENIISN